MKDDISQWDVLNRLGIEPLSPLKIDDNLEELTDWVNEFSYEDEVDAAVFGCGEGDLVEYTADHYPYSEVVGIEHSHEMADKAQEKVENYENAEIEEVEGVEYLNADGNEFNIIFSVNSIQETEDPVDTVNNTFYESLKNNGLVVSTFPGGDDTLPTKKDPETGEKILELDLSHEKLSEEFPEEYDGFLKDRTVPNLKQKYLTGQEKRKTFEDYEVIVDDFLPVHDESLEEIIALADSEEEYKGGKNPKTDYVVARKSSEEY